MRKWSFKEFKDWFSPIQKDLEKNDVYKQLEQPKSNYDLVSINSYQQLNNLAGASTGDGQNAGSAWCHSIGKTTYDAWVKKGANKFFVLVHKNYKNIKATKGENCPKDEYGLSLMALLVEVETGKLLNCTLRWNHVNTPQQMPIINSSLIQNFRRLLVLMLKKKIENPEERKKELQNQSRKVNSIIQQRLKKITVISNKTLSEQAKNLITEIIIPNNVTSIGEHSIFAKI